MTEGFRFELETQGNGALLTLHGEFDVANCQQLATTIAGLSGFRVVVIDLSKLEFIDSTGLGLLVRTHSARQSSGQRLVIVEGSGQVRRLLQLTGLSERLDLLEQVPELATL